MLKTHTLRLNYGQADTMFRLCSELCGCGSLIIVGLMYSHGNSRSSEEDAAIGGVLDGPTHVQGLWGPSVVQHICLGCMAEAHRVHSLGKGQHAPPLHQQPLVECCQGLRVWFRMWVGEEERMVGSLVVSMQCPSSDEHEPMSSLLAGSRESSKPS